mgnify:FL=1
MYRNLNNGKWSLKQRIEGKWVVVGHCDSCVIDGALPFVSIKSRTRCVAKQQREVHAWVEGNLSRMPSGFVPFQDRTVDHRGFTTHVPPYYAHCAPVTYQPFERDCFYHVSHGGEYHGSDFAMFGSDQKMRVS